MNIHEYQAKELLQKFGVATPRGKAASTPEEAEQAARELGTNNLVVKAQIHAGGRGKGTFANGFKGGVHLCKSPAEARNIAAKMLGQTDRKSTRLNSSHSQISYAVFCLKKKKS